MSAEGERILKHLVSAGPLANTSLRNRDADEIMLQTGGTIMSRGVLYDIVCKKLSPGVCRLSLRRVK